MRPALKLTLAFLLLSLLAISYGLIKGINMLDSSLKTQHETAFANKIQSSCLGYLIQYRRLPPAPDNRTLTAALLGDNSRHLPFISLSNDELNANKEMIDLWRTPVKITILDNSRIQITSAGPDKIFGTPDDIVNNPTFSR